MDYAILNLGVPRAGKTWAMLALHSVLVEHGQLDGTTPDSLGLKASFEKTRGKIEEEEEAVRPSNDDAQLWEESLLAPAPKKRPKAGDTGEAKIATVFSLRHGDRQIKWIDPIGDVYGDAFLHPNSGVRDKVKAQYEAMVARADLVLFSLPCTILPFAEESRQQIALFQAACKNMEKSEQQYRILLTKADRLANTVEQYTKKLLPVFFEQMSYADIMSKRSALGQMEGIRQLDRFWGSNVPDLILTTVEGAGAGVSKELASELALWTR